MAESCVDMDRCGTYYPGWLSGSHPTVNEGAVQRRVCFSYYVYGDCCSLSTYIRVRNCGGFFVYQLKPLTVCNSRYCGNGYGSSTPTTPGTLFLLSFLFSSCEERIRHLPMKQITDTLLTFIWLKWTPFSSVLPPLLPTNQPSNERIHQTALNDNCMVEILVFSPENSKWA